MRLNIRILKLSFQRYYTSFVTVLAVYFFIQYQLCTLSNLLNNSCCRELKSLRNKHSTGKSARRPMPCTEKAPKPEDPIFCKTADEMMEYDRPEYLPNMKSPCFKYSVTLPKDISVIRGTYNNAVREEPNQKTYLFCLPSVFIVGVSKSGTTDIFTHLVQHQHVIAPLDKEPHFWDNVRLLETRNTWKHYLDNYSVLSGIMRDCYLRYNKDECLNLKYHDVQNRLWKLELNMTYINNELTHSKKTNLPPPFISIDATTTYLNNALSWHNDTFHSGIQQLDGPKILTAHRLKHYIPNPKFIIFLRDPVQRLISDFSFFVEGKRKRTPQYFHLLIHNGVRWWKECISKLSEYRCAFGEDYSGTGVSNLGNGLFSWGDSNQYGNNGAGRLRIGIYIIYIQTWLQIFSKEQMYIDTIENYNIDVFNNNIIPFLDLEPINTSSYEKLQKIYSAGHKNAAKPKKKVPILKETRMILEEFYKPYNERLARLLNDNKFMFRNSQQSR